MEEIYLFGSRAKGEERPDSDYDLLIIVNRPDKEFRKLSRLRTPFIENVLKEEIKIG